MTFRNSIDLWDAYYRQNRYVTWWPNEQMIRFVVNERLRAGSERRALDLGCGNGRHLWLLAREGFDTVGIDLSRTALGMARKWMKRERLTVKVVEGDAAALPHSDATFDLCLVSHLLDYLPMPDALTVARELHRVMAPGASFCATLHSTRDREFGTGRKVGRNTFVLPASGLRMLIHYFDGREIEDLFGAFREVRIERVEHSIGEHLAYVRSHWVVTGVK